MAAVAIRVGHSADPDDAFMVWAFEAGKVDTRGLEFELVAADIQTLNEWALEGRLEVTALSAGAYPAVADRYVLLPHGASFGEGYGPIVVARERLSLDELRELEIATPGRAHDRDPRAEARARRRRARATCRSTRSSTRSSRAGAGRPPDPRGPAHLRRARPRTSCSTSAIWWQDETGLPLPLGVVVARRDLDRLDDVSAVLREAIDVGLANRDEAMAYAMGFGRGIDAATADEFVAMYVNDLTLDMGERGREAIALLLGAEPDFV